MTKIAKKVGGINWHDLMSQLGALQIFWEKNYHNPQARGSGQRWEYKCIEFYAFQHIERYQVTENVCYG